MLADLCQCDDWARACAYRGCAATGQNPDARREAPGAPTVIAGMGAQRRHWRAEARDPEHPAV